MTTLAQSTNGKLLARGRRDAVSRFEELVYYLSPLGERGKTVAAIAAYLDESGIHDGAKHCVIAGYVAGAKSWSRFIDNWTSFLSKRGIDDFHAKDLFQSRGSFGGWTDDDIGSFLGDLLPIVDNDFVHAIGVGTPVALFDNYSKGVRRIITGGAFRNFKWIVSGKPSAAYFVCFPHVLHVAARRTKPGFKVHYFFDRQDQYKGFALQYFDQLSRQDNPLAKRMGDIVFGSRHEHPPLQLADLLAYLLTGHLEESHRSVEEWCLTRLRSKVKNEDMLLFDETSVEKSIQQLPTEIRKILEEQEPPNDPATEPSQPSERSPSAV